MHAQLMFFDGPRSPELVAAAERAGKERVTPAAMADDTLRAAHHATYVLRQPDGGEIVIVVADDEAALELGEKVIGSAPLLPGEDPARTRRCCPAPTGSSGARSSTPSSTACSF